jgi:hypothetical protein
MYGSKYFQVVAVGRGVPFKIFDADVWSGSATATNIMIITGECKVADHGLLIGVICAATVGFCLIKING